MRTPLKSFLLKFSPCLVVAFIWQIFISVIALLVNCYLGNYATYIGDKAQTDFQPSHIFPYMTNWDGFWMQWITQGAYFDKNIYSYQYFSPAFFPGFPGLVSLLQTITFHHVDITLICLLINTVALAFSLYFLKGIQKYLLPGKNPWLLAILFLGFPSGVFQNFLYSEALFCALAFGAYYFALKRRWLAACIVLALATAVRSPAFLVIGLCGLEFMRSHDYKLKKICTDKNFYYFLIAPLGFIGYGIFLYVVRGDFLAMIHAQSFWGMSRPSTNIINNFVATIKIFCGGINGYWFLHGLQPLLAVSLSIGASIKLLMSRQKEMVPVAIYGIVSISLLFLTGTMASLLRFSLPILPIYLGIAQTNKKPIHIIYLTIGFSLQLILLAQFVLHYFAG